MSNNNLQNFIPKNMKERGHMWDPGVDGRIILK
jgi:hypothetical protein